MLSVLLEQIKTCWAAVINSLHLHDVSLIADIMGNIINLIDDKQGQGHGVPDMQLKQSQFTKNTLEHLLNIVNGCVTSCKNIVLLI